MDKILFIVPPNINYESFVNLPDVMKNLANWKKRNNI